MMTEDPAAWFNQTLAKMRRSPRFWWEYFKIWIVEVWLGWKWRNKTVYEIIEIQYPDLAHTAYWDEHPEDWEDGCFCATCRSYMANE
ncbi:MAG: hypothetical protein ACYSW3_00430 [Planctomycetota bacterium]